MLLSKMKDMDKCKHKKIAVEKIKIIESSKSFNSLNRKDIENSDGNEQEVILCLECGKELERN